MQSDSGVKTPDPIEGIFVRDGAVEIGVRGKPFLTLSGDGRVQFSNKTKPDSGAVRFLQVLQARWPDVVARFGGNASANATSPNKEPGQGKPEPAGKPEPSHTSIDEVPPAPPAPPATEETHFPHTHAEVPPAPAEESGMQVEETAGEELTLAEESGPDVSDGTDAEGFPGGDARLAAAEDKLTPAEEARVEAAISLSEAQEAGKENASDLV